MKKTAIYFSFLLLFVASDFGHIYAQETVNQRDGSLLWLSRYQVFPGNDDLCPKSYSTHITGTTGNLAISELAAGIQTLCKVTLKQKQTVKKGGIWLDLTHNTEVQLYLGNNITELLGEDGFIIKYLDEEESWLLTGNTEKALLYAVYHFLRLFQTQNLSSKNLEIVEIPAYQRRILNHWDNLDGTVERGYAGHSIWQWNELPQKISPRYKAYARANVSIGINGTVLNNVNANPEILTRNYLEKSRIIANELRPYGLRVYLSINFASPGVLGKLETSSPKDPQVVKWWKDKVEEIYTLIPDFGGFLVKANSEGQPGPMDFGCTHTEGANMLADILAPYNGIVMWRAFVYNPKGDDRAKQAYVEFVPLDGEFRKNVLLQIKNGPIDFQPREPYSPLFAAMENTTLMPEIQITQEYLGFSDHLVYLGTLYHEFLQSDTYKNGRGSTVAQITTQKPITKPYSGIAGVANIGLNNNWCGHPFAQSNWYVFGRLAWNPNANVRQLAKDWTRETLTQNTEAVKTISSFMMKSREATVNYMTPLGLHHLMGWGHHYGPEPWCDVPGARPDWLPSYYHKADSFGIGFNRSSTGSNATAQYKEPIREIFDNVALCPPEYLLWFHHVPWSHEMGNGNTLWQELCQRYQNGVTEVKTMQTKWQSLAPYVPLKIHEEVAHKLETQAKEATWWKDACLLYFQTFSHQPFPENIDKPIHNLHQLQEQKFDLKHHN